MKRFFGFAALAAIGVGMVVAPHALARGGNAPERDSWQKTFNVKAGDLVPSGRNPFFVLEPGYRLRLEGREGGEQIVVVITVLADTEVVDGTTTRVVEERESKDGNIVEVSRNFFAISKATNDVYYFGEDVNMYRGGSIVGHEGSWRSGVDGAKFGLAMPGKPAVGMKHYMEMAPGAMDRAEVVSVTEQVRTSAGVFRNCLKVRETSAVERGDVGYKLYAPGVGLVVDDSVRLKEAGFAK